MSWVWCRDRNATSARTRPRSSIPVVVNELPHRIRNHFERPGSDRVAVLDHYHHERPDRGLGLRPPDRPPQSDSCAVQRRDSLNGHLHKHYRIAA
jgi:hypothetical protein